MRPLFVLLHLHPGVGPTVRGRPEPGLAREAPRGHRTGATSELRKGVAGAALADRRATPPARGGEGGRSSSARRGAAPRRISSRSSQLGGLTRGSAREAANEGARVGALDPRRALTAGPDLRLLLLGVRASAKLLQMRSHACSRGLCQRPLSYRCSEPGLQRGEWLRDTSDARRKSARVRWRKSGGGRRGGGGGVGEAAGFDGVGRFAFSRASLLEKEKFWMATLSLCMT